MSLRKDAELLITWRREALDRPFTMDDICARFGWGKGSKQTYQRLSYARDYADQLGLCLTFATYDGNPRPFYVLTATDDRRPIHGLGTRTRAVATQQRNIGRQGRFMQEQARNELTRLIGELVESQAAFTQSQMGTLGKLLDEADRQ